MQVDFPLELFSLDSRQVSRLLDRRRHPLHDEAPMETHTLFEDILRIANRFVPSEAGSVLIDDPSLKLSQHWEPSSSELIFVSCFGPKSENLVGRRLPATQGIVGKTYMTGQPVLSPRAREDKDFYAEFDKETQYTTESIVCVPIRLGNATCGVLELINRKGSENYVQSELELLQIFAGYISTSLQNVLDANRYRELAKRDDLTGLYNDRFFNQKLTEEVEAAEQKGTDLSLIFLDLDRFKGVNDRYGHLVGSQTLREIGLALAAAVPEKQAWVARYGGDEFVVIAPGCDLREGIELAESIRVRIENSPFRIEPGTETGVLLRAGTVTASLGVASYRELRVPSGASSKLRRNLFIKVADQSMYEAKAQGKNRVCWGVEPTDAVFRFA